MIGRTLCIFLKPSGFCLLALRKGTPFSCCVGMQNLLFLERDHRDESLSDFIPSWDVSLSRFTAWNLSE